MKKAKNKSDVLGQQINCPSFQYCPLCYGCRSYDSKYMECNECAINKKINICNKTVHKSDLISKMIRKDAIKI